MAIEYKSLVCDLLQKKTYPILQDFVVMDIHYKLLPEHATVDTIHSYDRRIHDPMYVWSQHTDPYRLSYLVGYNTMFYIHETDQFQSDYLTIECQRVKLNRSYVDDIRNDISSSFEEELYHFITLLNFDIPKLSSLLGIHAMKCTRLLPQFIKLWVYKYETAPIQQIHANPIYFGPPKNEGVLPVRVVRGKLGPCTSCTSILSLNNDIGASLPYLYPYLWHYSDRFKCIFPLAYNPLENPLLVK